MSQLLRRARALGIQINRAAIFDHGIVAQAANGLLYRAYKGRWHRLVMEKPFGVDPPKKKGGKRARAGRPRKHFTWGPGSGREPFRRAPINVAMKAAAAKAARSAIRAADQPPQADSAIPAE